jgi:hypothetical protein
MTAECCVCCGQPLEYPVAHRYCSVQCATRQLVALGTLLQSTPQLALSVAEWRELGQSYATDLELLNQVLPTLEETLAAGPRRRTTVEQQAWADELADIDRAQDALEAG